MTVGGPAWPTRWPQANRVVEGLRAGLEEAPPERLDRPDRVPGAADDGAGAALRLWAAQLDGSAPAWLLPRLQPSWPELAARALRWRSDQLPDSDGLDATLRLVADAGASARAPGRAVPQASEAAC